MEDAFTEAGEQQREFKPMEGIFGATFKSQRKFCFKRLSVCTGKDREEDKEEEKEKNAKNAIEEYGWFVEMVNGMRWRGTVVHADVRGLTNGTGCFPVVHHKRIGRRHDALGAQQTSPGHSQ